MTSPRIVSPGDLPARHQAGELHGPRILERERCRRNEIQRLVVALEPDRRVEPPERERQRREAPGCPVDDEVVDLDRRSRRTAVRLLEMRRELAKEIELIRPWPENAQRDLRSERGALREIAIVAPQSDREPGYVQRCGLFDRDVAALRRPSPPCAAQ